MNLLIVFLILYHGILWEKTYGGTQDDAGFCFLETPDSCYIVAGNTYSFGNGGSDFYVLKIDINGDTVWTKYYGGVNDEFAFSIKEHRNGYVILGYSLSPLDSDIYIVKIDSEGNLIWEITMGDTLHEYARDFEITVDSNFIITGYKESPAGDLDLYFAKIDTTGNLIWERRYGGNYDDYGYSICKSNNGYISTGYTYSSGPSDADIYLVGIEENGDTLWIKQYGRPGDDDMAFHISGTNDGNYILCGSSHWVFLGYEICYMKITERGEQIWTKYNGSLSNDTSWCINEAFDNGYIITGNFGTLVWLLKTDSTGNPLWSEFYGGNGFDTGHFVKQGMDSCYIIVGKTSSFGAGGDDVYMIKVQKDIKVEEKNYPYKVRISFPVIYNLKRFKNYEILGFTGRKIKGIKTNGIYFLKKEKQKLKIILLK